MKYIPPLASWRNHKKELEKLRKIREAELIAENFAKDSYRINRTLLNMLDDTLAKLIVTREEVFRILSDERKLRTRKNMERQRGTPSNRDRT
jgi:hypothetical protein